MLIDQLYSKMNWKKIDLDQVNSVEEGVDTARRDSLTDKSLMSQKPHHVARGESEQLDVKAVE